MRKGIIALTAVLGGCTSLLGDFTVGDGGGSPDVTTDVGIETGVVDSAPDVAKDSPIDTGPTCGNINQQCCNGTTCNQGACCANTCLDVSKDSQNCGVCGHTCYAEQCLNGMCQPEKLTQVSDSRPGRVRLDTKNAYFISVYSTAGGSLYSCDQAGCAAPTTLLKNIAFAYDMVLDDSFSNVYVADYNAATLYWCFTNGCNLVPGIVPTAASGSVAGLAFRSELFAIIGVQPHEFKVDGSQDVSLGNGNEGANYISAPRGSSYIYWQNTSHSVRVAKDNVAQAAGDFWTSTSAESVLQVEGDGSYVAWVAEGSSSTSIYTCAVGTSCSGNNTIASGNVGYEAGALTVDGVAKTVYWTGVDSSASHAYVKTCSATTNCTSPITVASISTKAGAAVAGGVAVNNAYVYFTLEDAGTIYLYRVAK